MGKTIYLFIHSVGSGRIARNLCHVRCRVASTQFKNKNTLDALWWCVATVTTVGYGDIVPVRTIGRIVALFYKFFGISMIAILLSVITNTFYKRRFEKEEREKREEQLNFLKNELLKRLS